ncbi:MAG: DUF2938 domain-containing protein [Flavobacteriales bacterium]|jgi:hypothetical protein|nr:DUF2938 domain-containing protein [Flavobacteriales bacterium]
MNYFFHAIAVGIGATAIMDIYSWILKMFGVPTLDYRFLGRWIGHFFNGKFSHHQIFNSPPIKYELAIGWGAHYLIGITFACLLAVIYGKKWLMHPTLFPALIIGIVTIVAPFFIMQPAFGIGFAAAKVPDPTKARLLSLLAHTVFGMGLFLSAKFLKTILN